MPTHIQSPPATKNIPFYIYHPLSSIHKKCPRMPTRPKYTPPPSLTHKKCPSTSTHSKYTFIRFREKLCIEAQQQIQCNLLFVSLWSSFHNQRKRKFQNKPYKDFVDETTLSLNLIWVDFRVN